MSISIVLACRKIESAYEAIRLLSDDISADGSVRMVWMFYLNNLLITHNLLISYIQFSFILTKIDLRLEKYFICHIMTKKPISTTMIIVISIRQTLSENL